MTQSCLSWQPLTLHLRHPFALSYGVSETRESFWVRLREDAGWGEAAIPPYYRVDASEMVGCWERAVEGDRALPDELEQVERWIPDGPAAARCAVELALLDRMGKLRGLPLWKLLGAPWPAPRPTCFTISIDTPEAMARMAGQCPSYPILKIKLGGEDDEARLRAIRQARRDVRLVVDANAGWTRQQAIDNVGWLGACGVELIEQPVGKDDHAGLGEVQRHTEIAIVADESVQTMDDVEKLHGAGVRGINIKLMKTGGLLAAVRMIERARELGMKIMLGCMIETSVGVTAMAHLSAFADWLDLDAPLLIADDPFAGVTYDERAQIHLPQRPGIGVICKMRDE
jgi:L-alanine-DL-glutamate epimerase-like enolase superfamily enzyme